MYKHLNLKQEIKNTKQDYDNVLNKYNCYSSSVKKDTISRFKHQSLIFRFSNFDDQLGVNNHIQEILHQSSDYHNMSQKQQQDEQLLNDLINIEKVLVSIKYKKKVIDLSINQNLETCMQKKSVMAEYRNKVLENEKAVKIIRSGQLMQFQLQIAKKISRKEEKLKQMMKNTALSKQISDGLKQRVQQMRNGRQKMIEHQCNEAFRQKYVDKYNKMIKEINKELPEIEKTIKENQSKLKELQSKQQKFKVLQSNKLDSFRKVLIDSMKQNNKKYSYLNISMIFMELFDEKVSEKYLDEFNNTNYQLMIQKSKLIVEELKKIGDKADSEEKEHQFVSFKFNVLLNNNFMQVIQQNIDSDQLIMKLESLENKQMEQIEQEFKKMPEKIEEYKQMVGCLLQRNSQKIVSMKYRNMMGSNSMKSTMNGSFRVKSNESSSKHIGMNSLNRQGERHSAYQVNSFKTN